MSDVVIRTERLGKRYRKGAATQGTLIEWLRRRKKGELFWALRDVSFEVKRGEMLGIIGLNGAGKSTLLKILSRITRPNEGYAEVHGRVGSLLEVGTGFHPELTGRENIYLNGALIGMPRSRVQQKLDEIVEYSGVEEFLDTPLKRYSSGMTVRLGFAVAVNLYQEIMLVDEVLSVGDASFRERCLAKMDEMTGHGRTVLFVGHNLEMVSSSCDRVIWLEKGRIREEGNPLEVVQSYQSASITTKKTADGFLDLADRPGHREDGALTLTYVRLLDEENRPVPGFITGRPARLAIGYEIGSGPDPLDVTIGLTILSRSQIAIASCESSYVADPFNGLPASGELVCEFDKLALLPGTYKLALKCKSGPRRVCSIPNAGDIRIEKGRFYPMGNLPPPGSGASLLEYRWSLSDTKVDT